MNRTLGAEFDCGLRLKLEGAFMATKPIHQIDRNPCAPSVRCFLFFSSSRNVNMS